MEEAELEDSPISLEGRPGVIQMLSKNKPAGVEEIPPEMFKDCWHVLTDAPFQYCAKVRGSAHGLAGGKESELQLPGFTLLSLTGMAYATVQAQVQMQGAMNVDSGPALSS